MSANLDIPAFLKREPKEPKVAATNETKPSTEAPSKPAKAAKAPKAATPKAKAEKPTSDSPSKPEAVDAYGLHFGSLNSRAVALYARKEGATVQEVKTALGGALVLNVLTKLAKEGHMVKRVKEKGAGARSVTRYFLSK